MKRAPSRPKNYSPVHPQLREGAVEGDAVRVGGRVDSYAVALDEEGRGLLLLAFAAFAAGRGRERRRRPRREEEEGFAATVGFISRWRSASTLRRDSPRPSRRGGSACRAWHARRRARRSQGRGGAHGEGGARERERF